MKRILIPMLIILSAISFTACKKDKKDADPVAAEKKLLLRTVWHTTLEEYKYSDDAGANLFTKRGSAGSHYAFKNDGTIEFTDKANVVTSGTYKLYKSGDKKYVDLTLSGVTQTYLLTKIETQHMSWVQVKANQTYLIDGVEHQASKLDVLFELECACLDK